MSHTAQVALGSVVSLWRYPVKSMMGEELNAAGITERGLQGDRAYALVDSSDGKVASAKNPRKWSQLFDFRAVFVDAPRPMGDSHRHLMITDQEWDAFMDDLQRTFDKFGVPGQEQDELKAIVEGTKESIVVRPFQEGPEEAVGTAGGGGARQPPFAFMLS